MNNAALYDSALVAIASSNGAWISNPAPAHYAGELSAAQAIAKEIDSRIPTIATGATISQRQLLESIVKSVMIGRTPDAAVSYVDIANAVAAVFTEYATNLQDNDTGIPSLTPNDIIYVDLHSVNGDGSINKPFTTIAQATAVATSTSIICVSPGTYIEDVHLKDRQNLVCRVQLSSPNTFPTTESSHWPIIIQGDLYFHFSANIVADVTKCGIQDVFARDVFITANIDSFSNSVQMRRCWVRDISSTKKVNVRVQGSVPPFNGNGDSVVRSFLGGLIDVECTFSYWGLAADGSFAPMASSVNSFQLTESYLIITPATVINTLSYSIITNGLGFSLTGTGVPNINFTSANKTLQIFGWSTPFSVSGVGASIGPSGIYWSNEITDRSFNPVIITGNPNKLAFFSKAVANTPVSQPAVAGSRGGNAALTSLLTALDSLGLISNGTVP